jgi:hypothetical protein
MKPLLIKAFDDSEKIDLPSLTQEGYVTILFYVNPKKLVFLPVLCFIRGQINVKYSYVQP